METSEDNKIKLNYPCRWKYKIILDSNTDIDIVKESILEKRDYEIKKTNRSKNGKYQNYNLSILVHSDDDRVKIFEDLKKSSSIKIVL